ncbi:MAG: NUDIX hydrolase [Candidatus Aenigmatarchaeota archaeon]
MKILKELKGKNVVFKILKINKKIYDLVEYPSVAVIIPVIENKILLVKQYRIPFRRYVWEVPAGKIEKKEKPITAAKRELLEETGYKGKLKFIGKFLVSPGVSNEIFYFFLATKLKKIEDFNRKEIKEVKTFEIDKVLEITNDLKTIFSVYYLKSLKNFK